MGSMYDGNVGVTRFPDFSPVSKLEISCKIYFGQAFSGGALLWVW